MSVANKVLILEDEVIFGENLRRYLEHRGWDALLAVTGREAIAAYAAFAPDVILLDYRLPDMDGFEALCSMRPDSMRGCVLMTGHPADTVTWGAERLGIRRILCKPFSLARMESELRAACAEAAVAVP